eukprot:CAMPEP_0168563552 /NCGR_PEP_ID=MMETSP0413-20121227/12738_1 /TAXON_ID=136452 /ORGANISM="Filamoeba nolandi, Strain NC-AS-23-1" /LENGTH=489 /DNA_ID=CAMNT_0008595095 /DNA_START=63 /DNA_END=1532 /DNA_ORIENTATION=+
MSLYAFPSAQEQLVTRHEKLINNPNYHDLIFMVEKQQIYAHSIVVSVRAPELASPKDKKKVKSKKGLTTVDVTTISHRILLEVLHYVYCGTIEFAKLNVQQILQLNAAAIELALPRLQWMCEHHLRTHISLDNIFPTLKGAHALNQPSVKEFCYHFIVKSYNDFVANKDGVKDLGIELFQSVVEVYQQFQTGQLKPLAVPPEPANTIVQDYKQICENKETLDITLRFTNDYVSAHKAILAGQSHELFNLCSAPVVGKTKEHPEHTVVPPLKSKDPKEPGPIISADSFKALLRFVYHGDTKIEPLHAIELVPFARDYGLTELYSLTLELTRRHIDNQTALNALALTYLLQLEAHETIAKEIRENATNHILSNLQKINLQPLKTINPNVSIDLLLAKQDRDRKEIGLTPSNSSSAPTLSPVSSSSSVPSVVVPEIKHPEKDERTTSARNLKEDKSGEKEKKEDKKEEKKDDKKEKKEKKSKDSKKDKKDKK